MITEKDTEREKLKKSLETKINTLEDQLRNADHQKQTLIDEKVKTTKKIRLLLVCLCAMNLQMPSETKQRYRV